MQKLTSIFQKLITLLILPIFLWGASNRPLTLGITGVALKEDISSLFELKNYLTEQTGYRIKIKFARSYATMRHLILDGTVDIAYVCGATYLDLLPAKKVELLALPLLKGKPYYHSLVIARKGTPYRSLYDFREKIYAMSDPESNSGSLVPRYELRKHGEKAESFFKRIVYTYDHGESIRAVLKGFVQGASVDGAVFKAYRRNHPREAARLRVVQRFGPFGIPPFIMRKDLPDPVKAKLCNALIAMKKRAKGRSILEAMALEGFVAPGGFDYPNIREIKKALATPPDKGLKR